MKTNTLLGIITGLLVFFAIIFLTGKLVIQTTPAEDTSSGGSSKVVYQIADDDAVRVALDERG